MKKARHQRTKYRMIALTEVLRGDIFVETGKRIMVGY